MTGWITDSMDASLSELRVLVIDREACCVFALAIVNIYTLYGELGSGQQKLLQKKREKSKWSNDRAYLFLDTYVDSYANR